MGVGKKFLDAAGARAGSPSPCIRSAPVTGRQQHAFFDSWIGAEPGERLSETAFWNRQPFPDFHRRSFVAESDNDNMHQDTDPKLFTATPTSVRMTQANPITVR